MKSARITSKRHNRNIVASIARSCIVSIIVVATLALPSLTSAEEGPALSMRRQPGKPLPRDLVAQAGSSRTTASADLDTLVRSAKAEGDFLFYSDMVETVSKRIGDAFAVKYGIKTRFIRLGAIPLQQRFSAEADSNSFPANLVITSNALAFAVEGVKRGWFEPIAEAGLPVIKSGEFPSRFISGPVATIQIAPWLVAYNTEKVKGDAIPRDWTDILKPAFPGQVLLADPRIAAAYIEFWSLILDKQGPGFFDRLRAQNPRQYPGGVPAVQALAAGEGAFLLPAITAQVSSAKNKGGPVDITVMAQTTGVEEMLMLTARAKAQQPSAARLFANFLMSQEGNKVVNDDPGGTTVYETGRLPRQYESPNPGAISRRDEIARLLGFR